MTCTGSICVQVQVESGCVAPSTECQELVQRFAPNDSIVLQGIQVSGIGLTQGLGGLCGDIILEHVSDLISRGVLLCDAVWDVYFACARIDSCCVGVGEIRHKGHVGYGGFIVLPAREHVENVWPSGGEENKGLVVGQGSSGNIAFCRSLI